MIKKKTIQRKKHKYFFIHYKAIKIHTTIKKNKKNNYSFIKKHHYFLEGFHEMNVVIAILLNLQLQSRLRLTLSSEGSKERAVLLQVLDGLLCYKLLFFVPLHGAHHTGPDYPNDHWFWNVISAGKPEPVTCFSSYE